MHSVTVRMHSDSQEIGITIGSGKKEMVNVHDITAIQVNEFGVLYGFSKETQQKPTTLDDVEGKTDMGKMVEFLEWALSMVDENYKETGKIGFAEVIVYKAAKAHMLRMKENLR